MQTVKSQSTILHSSNLKLYQSYILTLLKWQFTYLHITHYAQCKTLKILLDYYIWIIDIVRLNLVKFWFCQKYKI